MNKTITKTHLEEIEEAYSFGDREIAHALLKAYTGIEARPYTAWDFYDEFGNYIGTSDSYSIRDLIKNAYIDVVDNCFEESEEEE